jgi:hypothetical protein
MESGFVLVVSYSTRTPASYRAFRQRQQNGESDLHALALRQPLNQPWHSIQQRRSVLRTGPNKWPQPIVHFTKRMRLAVTEPLLVCSLSINRLQRLRRGLLARQWSYELNQILIHNAPVINPPIVAIMPQRATADAEPRPAVNSGRPDFQLLTSASQPNPRTHLYLITHFHTLQHTHHTPHRDTMPRQSSNKLRSFAFTFGGSLHSRT